MFRAFPFTGWEQATLMILCLYCVSLEQLKASSRSLFYLIDRKSSSSRYGYIANLCVAKSARRQGIARHMVQFAINNGKTIHGAEKVFVHVHRHNKPAQALYQNLGFEV